MFTKNNALWDECFKDYDEDTYCGLTVSELVDIYIEWLQAVIVEKREPCRYCDGDRFCSTERLADYGDLPASDVTLDIVNGALLVCGPHCNGYEDRVYIEYCPKCGRKMGVWEEEE